jgi:hypothetical protein
MPLNLLQNRRNEFVEIGEVLSENSKNDLEIDVEAVVNKNVCSPSRSIRTRRRKRPEKRH